MSWVFMPQSRGVTLSWGSDFFPLGLGFDVNKGCSCCWMDLRLPENVFDTLRLRPKAAGSGNRATKKWWLGVAAAMLKRSGMCFWRQAANSVTDGSKR